MTAVAQSDWDGALATLESHKLLLRGGFIRQVGAGLWTYLPLGWFGFGGRYDAVQPNNHDSTQNFSVLSPRLYFRTDFVTHEQIMVQYSHYFYGSAFGPGGAGGMYPYNSQTGAANMGVDKNAAQIAAIIWF